MTRNVVFFVAAWFAVLACTLWTTGCENQLPGEPPSFSDQDKEILRLINGGDLATAEKMIDRQIGRDPSDPKSYLLKATHAWYSRYLTGFGGNQDSLKSLLRTHSQKTISLAESQPASVASYFYLGSAYSYLSRADIMDQQWFDAYSNARQGKNYLERLLQTNPDVHDACLNLGILKYFTATRLSWWQKTLAWMTNMDGTKDEALALLDRTATKGIYNKDEARFVLVSIYNFLESSDSLAWIYVERYHQDYPNNAFIGQQYLSLVFGRLLAEKGPAYLDANADSLKRVYDIRQPGMLNIVGYRFITKQRLDHALAVFKMNLDLFPEVANGYDSYAEALMLKGNREEAITYYTIALEKTNTDQTMSESFRESLRTGIRQKLEELRSGREP